MGLIVSLFIEHLAYLHPDVEGGVVHGASLSTAALLQRCARDVALDAMEIFLPPALMARPAALAEAAQALLPPERMGRGFLRFHPVNAVAEIWADRLPRILLCDDPTQLPRMRYLRDRFAVGPMPISCDTHSGETQRLIAPLTRMIQAQPVPYDAIVCLTEQQRQFTARMLSSLDPAIPEPSVRLELIPRAVDLERFTPVDAVGRRRARQVLGLPEEARIVLFFGRLNAYTKADLLPLIESFIEAGTPEDVLLLVGRDYPEGYAAKLREAGSELGHRLIIRREAVSPLRPVYYAASDLFIHPGDSVIEHFSNTTLEAMACGLPVIVSDWVGFSPLVEHEENGLRLPTWWMPGLERISALSPMVQNNADLLYTGQNVWVDAPAMTAALRRLLASAETRVAMGAAGRRRAEFFGSAQIQSQWHHLWEAQLAGAAAELPATADRRRAGADRLGQPSRYHDWFADYASHTISPHHRVCLNERGRTVAVRARPVRFYDDVLPLIHREIIEALFAILSESSGWLTCEAVMKTASARSSHGQDDVRFHLALLLKRGLLALAEPTG